MRAGALRRFCRFLARGKIVRKVIKQPFHPSDVAIASSRSETEFAVSAPMASAARGVTRVLLLADAPVLRRGLVSMVNETAGMQSVGTPGELRRALTLVETARPDAVVV